MPSLLVAERYWLSRLCRRGCSLERSGNPDSSGMLVEDSHRREINRGIQLCNAEIIRIVGSVSPARKWKLATARNAWTTVRRALNLADIASSEPSALSGRIAEKVRKDIAWKNKLKACLRVISTALSGSQSSLRLFR